MRAARSSSLAAWIAAGVTFAPESIRAISPTRSFASTRATVLFVIPPSAAFDTTKCASANAANRREVGDAEDLAVARDVGDGAADLLGDGAADAGVDLVEDVEARGAATRRATA